MRVLTLGRFFALLLCYAFAFTAFSDSNRITEFEYDGAGNIIRSTSTIAENPPVINSVTPTTIRQEAVTTIVADGTDLNGAQVSTSAAGLTISNVSSTETSVIFDVVASTASTTGPKTISFTTALGVDTADITVQPPAPRVSITPIPLIAATGGAAVPVTLQILPVDIFDHTFDLSIGDAAVATVTPANVTITAGQSSPATAIQVSGLADGVTDLTLSSTTLGNFTVTVFVTSSVNLPAGPNQFFSTDVGLVKEAPNIGDLIDIGPFVSGNVGLQKGDQPPAPADFLSPIVSPVVGFAKGSVITGVSPIARLADDTTATVTVNGHGLNNVDSVTVNASDGITVGALTNSPDGSSVSFPLTVASGSAIGARELQLFAGTTRIHALPPNADQIIIANALPSISFIEPVLINRGEIIQLRIVGNDLDLATGIAINPPEDITLGSTFSVNSDGTELTTTIRIGQFAVLGDRVISVLTPAGNSDPSPSAANTITITATPQTLVEPVVSPLVGLNKLSTTTTDNTFSPFVTPNVGLAKGAFIAGITPQVGQIGTTVPLTVSGQDLDNVTSVDMFPNDGVTVSAPVIAPDGLSLTVDVTIDAAAPTTLRNVQVSTATEMLKAVPPSVTLFRVTPLQPVIDTLDPIFVIKNDPAVTINVTGQNLDNASNVRLIPPDDVTVGAPSVNAEGTLLTFTLSANSNAVIGQRVVVVETPAGESSTTPVASNQITVADQVLATVTPLITPLVGLEKQTVVSPPTVDQLITSPLVGLEKQFPVVNETNVDNLTAPIAGLAKGSVAFNVTPSIVAINSTAVLTINGQDLDVVTDVSFNSPDDITITAPFTINGANTQIDIPISVGATAAETLRKVVLTTATGELRFTDPADGLLLVAGPQPIIQSMDPIISTIGSSLTLTINGINYVPGSTTVDIVPNTGVTFNTPTVNAAGTQITVPMIIDIAAPVGPRAITVTTPAGTTTTNLNPENTFTIAQ